MATFKERIDQHDREIAAIRKLILTGMKMFAKMEEQQVTLKQEHILFCKELRELAAQQRATAREVDRFIRSLRGGANGHSKRRFDVQ